MNTFGHGTAAMILAAATLFGSARAEDVTIQGIAIFKGNAAKFDPKPIAAVRGTQCDNGQDILDRRVLVNKNTSPPTLANVVVWLADGPVETRSMVPPESLNIEMVGCRFEPRITTAFIRQRVLVTNRDDIPHTFQTMPVKNRAQGVTIPKKNMPISLTFFDPEQPFKIQSKQYPWMFGWIVVFDQPYYLITDERGTFQFKDFPAGKYTFKAWHEVFGTQTVKIQASHGKKNIVEFVFSPDKKKTEKNRSN